MTNFALMDGQYPVSLGASDRVPEGAMLLPDGVDVAIYATKWLVEGVWVARPEISAPTVTQTVDGWMVSYAAPDGSVCDVMDRDLGWLDRVEAAGGSIQFVLADAGPYQIEVTAPRPWLGRTDNLVLA